MRTTKRAMTTMRRVYASGIALTAIAFLLASWITYHLIGGGSDLSTFQWHSALISFAVGYALVALPLRYLQELKREIARSYVGPAVTKEDLKATHPHYRGSNIAHPVASTDESPHVHKVTAPFPPRVDGPTIDQ
jgi:hypothetical protein